MELNYEKSKTYILYYAFDRRVLCRGFVRSPFEETCQIKTERRRKVIHSLDKTAILELRKVVEAINNIGAKIDRLSEAIEKDTESKEDTTKAIADLLLNYEEEG